MTLDAYILDSFNQYINATLKFNAESIGYKEYKEIILGAAETLKDYLDGSGKRPYVITKVKSIYIKTKKIGDNLEISYMDEETFQLTTNYKSS